MKTLLTVVATVAITLGTLAAFNQPRLVPACQEDEVVQGQGAFHSTGYWDRYVCINFEEVQ